LQCSVITSTVKALGFHGNLVYMLSINLVNEDVLEANIS